MRKHRLVLAYESSTEKDAFTQLTWDALQSGVVPVVVGPSNAVEVLPPNSFIWYGHYNNWDKFAQDIVKIADNQEMYDSYRTWRNDETAIATFEQNMNFTRTDIKCRTCRWAYAKMYGLKWDTDQQQILPSTIPRDKFCVSTDITTLQWVVQPFREVWFGQSPPPSPQQQGEETMDCNHPTPMDQKLDIDIDGHKVTRHIVYHDGVTDIELTELIVTKDTLNNEDSNKAAVPRLRLEFDIHNYEGASFPHPHVWVESNHAQFYSSVAIQDFSTRATILVDWVTDVLTSPQEGVVEIGLPSFISHTQPRKIRIILEDVDRLNYKLTEFYPFAFGKQMTLDFVNPMELYYPAI
jgi:hypothetical protein